MDKNQSHMMTLGCSDRVNCGMVIRVGRFLHKPEMNTRIGAMKFCPFCGASAAAHYDMDEAHWECLAESYEITVEAVKAIYAIWHSSDHQSFGTFVEEMKREAAEKYREVEKAAS